MTIDACIWLIALVSAFMMLAGLVIYGIILLGHHDDQHEEQEENIIMEEWEDI